MGDSIAFELGDTFRFAGTIHITVYELLEILAVKRNVLEVAKALLLMMLSKGRQESALISQAAQKQNISECTIKTAKKINY